MLKEQFQKFDNFVFDLDGTIWRWTVLMPGAKEAVQEARKAGKKVLFLTGNSRADAEQLAKRLARLGIKANPRYVLCPLSWIPWYLKKRKAKRVFLIGEKNFRILIEKEGIKVVDSEDVDFVVVGQDRKFNYHKLKVGMHALIKGAEGISAAKGSIFIMKEERLPGTGAFAAALEAASGKKMRVIGKPSIELKQYISEKYRLNPKKTIFLGDELDSDVPFAHMCGWKAAFVKGGRDSLEKAKDLKDKPDFVLNNLREVIH